MGRGYTRQMGKKSLQNILINTISKHLHLQIQKE